MDNSSKLDEPDGSPTTEVRTQKSMPLWHWNLRGSSHIPIMNISTTKQHDQHSQEQDHRAPRPTL